MRLTISGVFGEIDSLPGCTQIGVSHSVFLPKEQRGKGIGMIANSKRTKHMKEKLGYDYAVCTVNMDNAAQLAIMRVNHWTQLDSFMSSKTGHIVVLFGKSLV